MNQKIKNFLVFIGGGTGILAIIGIIFAPFNEDVRNLFKSKKDILLARNYSIDSKGFIDALNKGDENSLKLFINLKKEKNGNLKFNSDDFHNILISDKKELIVKYEKEFLNPNEVCNPNNRYELKINKDEIFNELESLSRAVGENSKKQDEESSNKAKEIIDGINDKISAINSTIHYYSGTGAGKSERRSKGDGEAQAIFTRVCYPPVKDKIKLFILDSKEIGEKIKGISNIELKDKIYFEQPSETMIHSENRNINKVNDHDLKLIEADLKSLEQ